MGLFLETAAPTDPLSFIQYGILGLILVLILTGWLWAKPAVEELQKRHAEERKLWEDRILPTMDRLSRNIERNNNLLRQTLRSRGVAFEESDADN
jgi:hypothetical protein